MDSLSMLSPSKMVGRRGCIWQNRGFSKRLKNRKQCFTDFWKALTVFNLI